MDDVELLDYTDEETFSFPILTVDAGCKGHCQNDMFLLICFQERSWFPWSTSDSLEFSFSMRQKFGRILSFGHHKLDLILTPAQNIFWRPILLLAGNNRCFAMKSWLLPFHIESALCYYDHYVLAATSSAMKTLQAKKDIVYRCYHLYDIM